MCPFTVGEFKINCIANKVNLFQSEIEEKIVEKMYRYISLATMFDCYVLVFIPYMVVSVVPLGSTVRLRFRTRALRVCTPVNGFSFRKLSFIKD